MQQIVGTLVGRWYVMVFGVAFLVFATRHLGVKRMLAYSAVALGAGAMAENGAVFLGFPYTRYMFNPDLRGHELWIFDVPLMVPMSYAFLTYFAFATARLLVSGPFTSRGRQPILEYVLAVVLATWALWVIDPVSRLGRYHLLGELFQYAGPGFWFGLPLGSQLGFFATSGILIALLTYMMRDEPAIAVAGLLRHPRLPALLTYLGEVIFMAGTAFVVARINGPGIAAQADPLVGAALIIAAPLILVVAIYWRSLPRPVVELERTPRHGGPGTPDVG